MTNTILFFIVLGFQLLLGFIFYSFLSKIPKKGKTKVEWIVVLFKILQIKFKSEHDNNHKK